MRRWLRPVKPFIAPFILALIIGVMCAATYVARREGHWWGDDWALYIRQAKALLDGDTGRVAAQNGFTVSASIGPPFSPPVYPWGYPIVLAAAIPLVGESVDSLWIINMISAAIFACCWYVLAKPRVGTAAALAGMAAVCYTPQLMSWMDLVQSEWVFMAAIALTMMWLDRLVRGERLLDAATPLWMLLLLGIGAAAGFEVRREGLAMIAAIGAAQIVDLIARRHSLRHINPIERWGVGARLVLPHLSFLVVVLGIKAIFPAYVVPRYGGVGVYNLWRHREGHVKNLADLIGLRRSSLDNPTIFGNATAGWSVTVFWFVLLATGLVLATTLLRRQNAHLAAYAVAAFVIGGSARSALSRYFASMAPVASLLAMVALVWIVQAVVQRFRRPDIARIAAYSTLVLILIPLIVANGYTMRKRVINSIEMRERGSIEWGAQHPMAQEMFDVVVANSEPDDVVATFKARAMVLMTGRNAVQVDGARPLDPDLDIALLVAEDGDQRDREYGADPDWEELWRNSRLVIYAPTDR